MGGTKARKTTWATRLLIACMLCFGVACALGGCAQQEQEATTDQSAEQSAQSDQATKSETRMFTDSAGRTVEIPAQIDRIAPAGHTATQILLTMAPEKMVTISQELSDDQAKYLGADYASLPATGAAFGAKGDLNKEAVAASGASPSPAPKPPAGPSPVSPAAVGSTSAGMSTRLTFPAHCAARTASACSGVTSSVTDA